MLIALVSAVLFLVGGSGKPVANARVTFFDLSGHSDMQQSDRDGAARSRAGFDAIRAAISAKGFENTTLAITTAPQRVVLVALLPVIGSVRVATGSPQSLHALAVPASALDHSAIALNPSPTTDALLRALPGFDPVRSNSEFTNYGQLRASFSGAGNDRGLVLVDGIPAQDGFGGQIDWAAYPPSEVQYAELLRGPGSALYGPGAIGGALNLRTYGAGADNTAQVQAQAGAGTQAFSQEWLNARAPAGPKLAASISAGQQRSSYDDLPPGYQSSIDQPAVAYSGAASLHLRYRLSSSSSLQAGERIASDWQDEGRPNYTFSRRFDQFDTRYEHTSSRSDFSLIWYARNAFIVNSADMYPTKPGVLRYLQDVPTSESGSIAQWSVDSGTSAFEVRADTRWIRGGTAQYAPSGSLQSNAFGTQSLSGLALQETARSPRLETLAGVRLDKVLSPRAALRYKLTSRWNLRASAGTGYRQPFLNELLRSYFIGSVEYEANPALSPERSASYSAGADWASANAAFAADVIHTTVRDAIMFETLDATHQQRSNVAQTQTDAVTLTYSLAVTPISRISAYLTLQHPRVTVGPQAIVGKQLQYVPSASGTLAYQTISGHTGLGVDVSYIGPAYADDLNTEPLGTAVLAGGRIRVPISSSLGWIVTADNALSARYRSSVDRWGTPSLFTLSLGWSQ